MNLSEARLYLVTPAKLRAGSLVELIPDLVTAGVDIIQLREKELEAGAVLRLAEPIGDACAAAGVPFILNDRPDVALAVRGAGVHVGQDDLPVALTRRIMGPEAIVGLSTHSREDIAAVPRGVDYIAVGPLFETPTKPGRPAVGLDLVRHAANSVSLPWFAIGGIDASNIMRVLDAGAKRVVVVRALTQAKDPVAAAEELSGKLKSAGSTSGRDL
ncbi:MAG: thiamine-phosphate pyrophosphorylase [Actinomycetota bacterium]|nr:thiamine-phosphate pyrophosphorylase [Actinomycetota bacterium]